MLVCRITFIALALTFISHNVFAAQVEFPWEHRVNDHGQILIVVENTSNHTEEIQFTIYDIGSDNPSSLPLDQWASNINPGDKDNELLKIQPHQTRNIVITFKNQGTYLVCHGINQSVSFGNCKTVKY